MLPPNLNQVYYCANPEREAVLPQTSNVIASAFLTQVPTLFCPNPAV